MGLRAPAGPDAAAEAVDFVRFCYARRRVGWPELYDEMCSVARRGLYEGWGPAELEERGIGFRIEEMASLADLVRGVVAEDPERHAVPYRLSARRSAAWSSAPKPPVLEGATVRPVAVP
jgi:hypothetical protein